MLNKKDRLNSISLKIIKKEKDSNCVICKTAIKETAKVYRNKLNNATSKIFPILWKIKDIENSFERDRIILEEIKKLMESEPNLENFFELLYKKISSYIEKVGINTLPHYLSELSENITRTIDKSLYDIVEYYVIFIEFDDSEVNKKYSDIKKVISSIRFKDSADFDIFCEIVIYLSDGDEVNFYTDDKEFKKKGVKAYSLLEKNLAYNKLWLKLIHTDEIT